MANTGGRLYNLSYEGNNIVTDEDGYKLVELSGNYVNTPFVGVTADVVNVQAFVTSVFKTATGWSAHIRSSSGEQGVRYQAWGEIRETW